jgi:hypothetical protein
MANATIQATPDKPEDRFAVFYRNYAGEWRFANTFRNLPDAQQEAHYLKHSLGLAGVQVFQRQKLKGRGHV